MRSPPAARLLLAALALAAVGGCGGGDGESADDGTGGGTVAPPGGTRSHAGPAATASDERPLVAMVGDSITVAALSGLEEAAAARGYELVIDAEIGRRITGGTVPNAGTDAVSDLLATPADADVWVIALGTNDIGKYDAAGYAVQIDALLELLPADVPLVWINVYLPSFPTESARFNRALNEALGSRGSASVGAWTAHADDDGVLADGVHPSEEGEARFVDIVTGQIEHWLRTRPDRA